MRIQKLLLALVLCGSASFNAHAAGNALGNSNLVERIAALESLVIQLQSQIENNGAAAANNSQDISNNSVAISAAGNVLQFVSVVDGQMNGVAGPHFIIEGANVHVRSGAGSTGEGCFAGNAANCLTRTGLGNLIVGYNEPRPSGWDPDFLCASNPDAQDPVNGRPICTRRDGAHHLVVGQGNNFIGHGGAVLGLLNEARGSHATVTGGRENAARAQYSSVSGGVQNIASRSLSSVSGGWGNRADGAASNVSGGQYNVASGFISSVGAGLNNNASGEHSVVSGGIFSLAIGPGSAVSGGRENRAIGGHSSVSGGEVNFARNFASAISGGSFNQANGERSSVSGGQNKTASGNDCVVGDDGIDC